MEFKEKIKTVNFSKFTVTPVYKKIDRIIEGIQYDKDKIDAAQSKVSKPEGYLGMRPLTSYPKEFIDYVYQQVDDASKPDLETDMPKETMFNINPHQIANINVMPEDRQRLEYIVEKHNR